MITGGRRTNNSGILRLKESGKVSVRVKAVAGRLSSGQLLKLSDLADNYGDGYICTTARLNIEIPGVDKSLAGSVIEELSDAELSAGSTASEVRSVAACKGTVCRHGCCDTWRIAEILEEEQAGRMLPRKIKIAVAGCPNNCSRVQLNDIGFMGHRYPEFRSAECNLCGACEKICNENAVRITDGKLTFDPELCIGCGDCIDICKNGSVLVKEAGVSLFLGGRAGREIIIGSHVRGLIPESEIPETAERLITYFSEHAKKGERFGSMTARIGKAKVFNDLGFDSL